MSSLPLTTLYDDVHCSAHIGSIVHTSRARYWRESGSMIRMLRKNTLQCTTYMQRYTHTHTYTYMSMHPHYANVLPLSYTALPTPLLCNLTYTHHIHIHAQRFIVIT